MKQMTSENKELVELSLLESIKILDKLKQTKKHCNICISFNRITSHCNKLDRQVSKSSICIGFREVKRTLRELREEKTNSKTYNRRTNYLKRGKGN